ncbi:MAG: phosphoribosylamine--glycine ligase [Candidatus Marinimicrobia bacterium]|nr:phosphoribosylamine--glycine ligase [Candidatus Neomarinimicrobiota bacterium]
MKKNILILGSGGREYAFVWKLYQDKNVEKVFCSPGNAGTSKIAENISLSLNDHQGILDFVNDKNIDLTIVGPEGPLDSGIVDFFKLHDKKIFGPDKAGAKLESSKIYARDIMKKYDIPHPKYISCSNRLEVEDAKSILGFPIVLKADGLAAGKGVIICNNEQEFTDALSIFFDDKNFGKASEKISVEECIAGPEISIFTVCNGSNYIILNNAQDHKRVFDGDLGPNTGGMGAYAPTPLYNKELEQKIKNQIIEPTLSAMINEGSPYSGFLYFGLMLVNAEPYVIEYNVRMGDPETQVVVPMMETSLLDLIDSALDNRLDLFEYKNKDGYCITVVLAAEGYPGSYKKGHLISGLDNLSDDLVFHAGTSFDKDGSFITSGGRILNAIGFGETLELAIEDVYRVANNVRFKNIYYRKDIAKKGLNY